MTTSLLVLAKEPVQGRVKTRLCPPCTPAEAAELARASLADTLKAAGAAEVDRHVVVWEGAPPQARGFEVIPQRGEGLAARLAAAFEDAGGPSVLIGMDSPQVTPQILSASMRLLLSPTIDAVIGPALDGGYWAIGLRLADSRVFEGVPMSESYTCRAQVQRLADLGLRVAYLPVQRDIDRFEDAVAVARAIPASNFGRALLDLMRAKAS